MNERLSHTRIAVGSQNKAKNEAVKTAFEKVYNNVETHGFDVPSGIADQPKTNEESIEGAINRARGALELLPEGEFGVGLEGNVYTVADRMMLLGWVAIINREGIIGIGNSSGIELPESFKQAIENGAELGPLLQSILNDEDNEIRHTIGTNGVLSGGLYDRRTEFVDATTAALPKFVKPELYQ